MVFIYALCGHVNDIEEIKKDLAITNERNSLQVLQHILYHPLQLSVHNLLQTVLMLLNELCQLVEPSTHKLLLVYLLEELYNLEQALLNDLDIASVVDHDFKLEPLEIIHLVPTHVN